MKTTSATDKNYLRLQFWNKVYKKNATEFQSFFEDIMTYAYPGFQKIWPYGKKGDGGNDGYIPAEGVYYQVYAPKNPNEKELAAARKIKDDFNKLKNNWDEIATIKTFLFVFNDKGFGVSYEIEKALSELRKENPEITFNKLTPLNLEDIFFGLDDDQILALDFDTDLTNGLKMAYEYLEKVEIDLDRDNAKFVEKALNSIAEIVTSLDNEDLDLHFKILQARTLEKMEYVKEARNKYENLAKRYPKDPRPILYEAEIQLHADNLEMNRNLLDQAKAIDKENSLLVLEKLIRSYITNEMIDLSKIDENDFPHNPKMKAGFYRIYSGFFERAGDSTKADYFIERAIALFPDKYANYDTKLGLLERRLFVVEEEIEQKRQRATGLLTEIDFILQYVFQWEELGPRNKSLIYYRRINAFLILEDLSHLEQNAKNCFELLLQCYFDHMIDTLLAGILDHFELPDQDLRRLLQYLSTAEKRISDTLAKRLVLQFMLKDTLCTEGKEYFQQAGIANISDFIHNIEEKNHKKVIDFLTGDPVFAVAFANTIEGELDLRLKIIESLPNDGSVQKDKLLLLLNYDEGDLDKAFSLLKKLDLSNLGYLESRYILRIASDKKAWDFVAILLENLIKYEKNNKIQLDFTLQLFTAYYNLEKYNDAAQIGEALLSNIEALCLLDDTNKENLLVQTILARMKRGEYKTAQELMEEHGRLLNSFEAVLGLKVNVYLKNNNAENALASIVEGIKLIKTPTPEQYGRLLFCFVEIDNLIEFTMVPLKEIINGCFVKLKNQERWYFVGEGDELDATKVSPNNEAYELFIQKRVGELIEFKEKYRAQFSKFEIENIQPIERYIQWQSQYNAEKLTVEKRWNAMEIIDVPTTDTGIDTQYIIARLEDEKEDRVQFFDMYVQNYLPLAFLAVSQGGLPEAIGCIASEEKGYIHFSSGNIDEINQQKEIAKRILSGEEFYIDGTSALVLGETGLLEEIYPFLPGLRTPQSVITALMRINDRFRYSPGLAGHLSYTAGKLRFFPVDSNKRKKINKNFDDVIRLLESQPLNIKVISEANKTDGFSERRIEPALCDACILAQRDGYLVLTDDYLYLQVNELDTKKRAPKYSSSFALVRVLYEQRKINFDKFISFFSYLSSYRYRFLPITVDDIEKAVFGGNDIKVFTPERIRLLNFPLTLSEEYGVPLAIALSVVGQFLIKALIDDTIVPEMMERIFIEIIEAFPTNDKNRLGQLLISESVRVINKAQKNILLGGYIQEKVNALSKLMEVYKSKIITVVA